MAFPGRPAKVKESACIKKNRACYMSGLFEIGKQGWSQRNPPTITSLDLRLEPRLQTIYTSRSCSTLPCSRTIKLT